MADIDPRWLAAFVAGHAVAETRLGPPYEEVNILRSPYWTSPERPMTWRSEKEASALVTRLSSGWAALRLRNATEDIALQLAREDLARIEEVLERLNPSTSVACPKFVPTSAARRDTRHRWGNRPKAEGGAEPPKRKTAAGQNCRIPGIRRRPRPRVQAPLDSRIELWTRCTSPEVASHVEKVGRVFFSDASNQKALTLVERELIAVGSLTMHEVDFLVEAADGDDEALENLERFRAAFSPIRIPWPDHT